MSGMNNLQVIITVDKNFEQKGARVFEQKKKRLSLRVLFLPVGHTIATLTVDWILYYKNTYIHTMYGFTFVCIYVYKFLNLLLSAVSNSLFKLVEDTHSRQEKANI